MRALDRLDALVTALVRRQREYALRIANACLLLFVLNCAGFGFALAAAPASTGHFFYGATMFFVGAVANYLLAVRR